MRLAYSSAERIELQFASKESARAMAEPTTADVEAQKRCIRFLLKYQRCIQSIERQEILPKQLTCFSNSNFAGCLQRRDHGVVLQPKGVDVKAKRSGDPALVSNWTQRQGEAKRCWTHQTHRNPDAMVAGRRQNDAS